MIPQEWPCYVWDHMIMHDGVASQGAHHSIVTMIIQESASRLVSCRHMLCPHAVPGGCLDHS